MTVRCVEMEQCDIFGEADDIVYIPRVLESEIPNSVQVWYYTHIRENVVIGENVSIGSHCYIGPNVKIGEDTRIQSHCFIPDGVTIGKNCFIGPGTIFTNDKTPRSPPDDRAWSPDLTEIGNNVVIGAHCTILPVNIGDGCKVGAGVVVRKNITKNDYYGWYTGDFCK